MANWHALGGIGDGNSYTIAYHIAIPSANNSAGFNYQAVLITSGIGGTTILKEGDGTGGTISAAEKASIQSGAIYEYVETFATNPARTALQLQGDVDARFSALSDTGTATSFINQLKNRLKWFGATH